MTTTTGPAGGAAVPDRSGSAVPAAALAVLATTWFGLLLLPVDFVDLAAPWAVVNAALTAIGSLVAVWALLTHRYRAPQRLLFALLLGLLVGPVLQGHISATLLLLPTYALIGFTLGMLSRRVRPSLALGLLAVMALVLTVEVLLTRHVYSEALGVPYRQALSTVGFRARGVLGQPVPASMAAVTGLVLAWGAANRSPRPRLVRLAAMALAAICLLSTGTRSAVVVLAVVVLLAGASRWRRGPRATADPRVVLAWLTSSVGVLVAGGYFWDELRGTRLLSFTTLDGSTSLTNRLRGADVLQRMQEDPLIDIVLGRGLRSLQEDLIRYNGMAGITTVDNQLITSLWDSGLLAFAVLTFLLVHSVRVCVSPRCAVTGESTAVCAALLGCLFFDALYVRSTLLIITAVLGLRAAQSMAPRSMTVAQP